MDLANASTGLEHVNNALAENMERFQSKKIQDVKTILYELIYSEMQYHSKGMSSLIYLLSTVIFVALEVLSNVQSSIFAMDMETDIAEVREKLGAVHVGTINRSGDV
jgi:hypothetical protein